MFVPSQKRAFCNETKHAPKKTEHLSLFITAAIVVILVGIILTHVWRWLAPIVAQGCASGISPTRITPHQLVQFFILGFEDFVVYPRESKNKKHPKIATMAMRPNMPQKDRMFFIVVIHNSTGVILVENALPHVLQRLAPVVVQGCASDVSYSTRITPH
jgi:hypothetical protein